VALLVVHNLRDIPGDTTAGKNTLAVRLGAPATRVLYTATIGTAFVAVVLIAVVRPWALVALVAVPLAIPPARTVLAGETGRGLIAVLQATGRLQLVFGFLLAAGIAL
jgi:1,4-dihydroxy-2-naphthoate polyprenyltransferase